MSEYTPTTDEVREAYVVGVDPDVTARYRAEFDRWLAEVERAAAIKAIEHLKAMVGDPMFMDDANVTTLGSLKSWLAHCAEAYRREWKE